MNKLVHSFLASVRLSLALAAATVLAGAQISAQQTCTELISGLEHPLGITQSNQGNLIVSETGTGALHSGRISIVDLSGSRKTLLDGLPSAINDVNEPSGPAGVFMRGRTLFVAIGVGDVGLPGAVMGTAMANPNPSSPIFSSVLAITFSVNVERATTGFALTADHQQALANGQKVTLVNARGDRIMIELIANFPDFTPNPLPFFMDNIRLSNPFDLVAVGDQLYVTDGGRNSVWQIDIPTGSFSTLAEFPNIDNPFFPFGLGPPFSEAVPTGIAFFDEQLLVTLFRGVPFAPGTSVVEQVDPLTGDHAPFIDMLKTAIDVLPITSDGDVDYLVLQHASIGPFFGGPGLLLRFDTPDSAPVVVADCLSRPTSMTLDEKTGAVYVTELVTGRIVRISL